MEPIRIDIDELEAAQRHRVKLDAAGIVIDAIREAGVCPRKAARVPILQTMAQSWVRGETTREQFVQACRKVLILNPTLAEVKS